MIIVEFRKSTQTAALDTLDRKILFELDCNARLPLSQLSKRLKQGRDKVEYRVERLLKEQIIRNASVVINPAKLGLVVFKVHLRLAASPSAYTELLQSLQKNPAIYWIAECAGHWSLIFAVAAKNPDSFYREYVKILSTHGAHLLESNISTVLEAYTKSRNYLHERGISSAVPYGRSSDVVEIDDLDSEILEVLFKDARASVAEIARLIGSPTATIDYRLKRLESTGVIVAYRLGIDLERIGKLLFKSQLYFGTYTAAFDKKLIDYCMQHPHVTYFSRQIADAPIDIEFEIDSFSRYSELIHELQLNFPGFIRNISTVLLKNAFTNFGNIWKGELHQGNIESKLSAS